MTVATPDSAAEPAAVAVGRAGDGSGRRRPDGWPAASLWAAVGYLVLILPSSRPGTDLRDYTTAACFAIVALSLNVLLGYVGQISLGHAAFVGIGAFTSAYLVTAQGQSFWVGVLGRDRDRRGPGARARRRVAAHHAACTSP